PPGPPLKPADGSAARARAQEAEQGSRSPRREGFGGSGEASPDPARRPRRRRADVPDRLRHGGQALRQLKPDLERRPKDEGRAEDGEPRSRRQSRRREPA